MPIREAQSRSSREISFADVQQAPCRGPRCNRVDSSVFSDGQSDRFWSIFRSFSGEKRTDAVNQRGTSRRQRKGTATSATSAPRRATVPVVALTLLVAACGTPLTWWLAPTGRNHPLAERIWGVQAGSFVAPPELDAGLPIVATNLSRVAIEAIRRNGLAGLSGQLARQLGLELPLSPEMREAMRRELDESHCRTMDGVALERMVDIQWARDARMAEALVRGGQRDGALLIAGAGHVRTDRGVPLHLQRRAPSVPVVSLAFLEGEANAGAPAAYAARFEGAFPFDYVWFTPRGEPVDPCP